MKKPIYIIISSIVFVSLLVILVPYLLTANPDKINVSINLRGVYKSKISVIPLASSSHTPIAVIEKALNNSKNTVNIPSKHLPGEFLLHFEYYQNENSTRSLSAEKMILLYQQNIELWVNPLHVNNPDSTYFNKNEKENTAFLNFMRKINKNKEMLDLLQNFLHNYDNKDSDFYKAGIEEANKRLKEHNQWIDEKIKKHKGLFVSSLFSLYYMPEVDWSISSRERQQNMINNYFNNIDFNDTLLIKSSSFQPWMDNYVNLHVEFMTNQEAMDSIFTMAGFNAIEKSKKGHPLFYGWMVDYFFKGYERLNIQKGIAMLAPYIADPNCMTQRRQEIERRLEGITTLVKGVPAPNFNFVKDGIEHNFWDFETQAPYKFLIFWSAGCPHCVEMAKSVYNWYLNNKSKVEIFAISLDEDKKDISDWKKLKNNFEGWNHILAEGGVNSRQANSYFILSTPTMFIINSKNNTILSLPNSINEIISVIN